MSATPKALTTAHQPSEEVVNLFVLKTWLKARFGSDQRGASMVEYGMLLLFIAILSLFAVEAFGQRVSSHFSSTSVSIN